MKTYEPITLTHMQAYLLQFVLEKNAAASDKLGSSYSLSRLYDRVKGTPAPTAEDLTAEDLP